MIAIWQATENGLANFVRIQLRVQRWHCGIGEATALMTAYRGPGESAHTMWALWREEGHVYV